LDLAIFDLDNTLLGGDSDYLWGQFLGENGYVDAEEHQKENNRYYDDYLKGNLDINAFLEFQFQPLAENNMDTILAWRERFLNVKIWPAMLPKAIDLIEDHRNMGHKLLIITATNSFITAPIAKLFNVDDLIASEPAAAHHPMQKAKSPAMNNGHRKIILRPTQAGSIAILTMTFHYLIKSPTPLPLILMMY